MTDKNNRYSGLADNEIWDRFVGGNQDPAEWDYEPGCLHSSVEDYIYGEGPDGDAATQAENCADCTEEELSTVYDAMIRLIEAAQ